MTKALRLALIYFAAVFAVAFVLGTIRTLVLFPMLGEMRAVLLELPVILTVAWLVCGRLLRGSSLTAAEAAAMGTMAFVLVMLGEVGLSFWLAGRTLAEHLALYVEPTRILGLSGQIAFAAIPLLRR